MTTTGASIGLPDRSVTPATPVTLGGDGAYAGVADFNGDGNLDVSITYYGLSGMTTLLGNGDGTFQPRRDYPAGQGPASVVIGDLNESNVLVSERALVTLTNRSGTSYPNARLQLVAGDVNRVRSEMRLATKSGRGVAAEAPAAQAMRQESLFE